VFLHDAVQGRQSIVQLRLGGNDVLGTGFEIDVADEDSGSKLVVADVLGSASDALRLLMNAGIFHSVSGRNLDRRNLDKLVEKWTG